MTTSKRPRSWRTKFAIAFRGIAVGARGQDSFYVHVPAAVGVIAAGFLLDVSIPEWGILILCITLVCTAELFNSSLEWLAKAVDEDHNSNIGNALDIACGAVLVASIGAAVVGCIVLGHRLWLLMA